MLKGVMNNDAEGDREPQRLVLGIDTCGPEGSVALARLLEDRVEVLEQKMLAGRSYSATLITAVGDLLAGAGIAVRGLHAIVAVQGPGSFTGVRVGLSAVKGLADATGVPVAVVSRLAVLAGKAQVGTAALDAHRHEVFLRVADGGKARELLAGRAELAAIAPARAAVCEEAAAELLRAAWPEAELVRVEPPTAADAIDLAQAKVRAGEFADIALLDGHYLRRSDAEIFGDPTHPGQQQR